MKIFLVLGCWGREKESIILCPATSNRILDLTPKTETNTKISNYLDEYYKMFDKPLYNNIHTALYNINDKFSEETKPVFPNFKLLEEFCIFHAKCGLYLKLELEE